MIIVRLTGGMGNQMFQYAAGRALSLKQGVPLALDTEWLLDRTPRPKFLNFVFRNYDLDLFTIDATFAERSDVPLMYRSYLVGWAKHGLDFAARKFLRRPGQERNLRFDPKILALGPNAYLSGVWQSPSYFESIADVIRKDFMLKAPLSEQSARLKAEVQSCASVCLNVRRGDFVTSDVHGTMGTDYYDRAIALYVFSDDIAWCEANLKFSFPTFFVGKEYKGPKYGEYLELMRACRNFIIPNSTFAWWAAWLSENPDKIVIAPKRWFLIEDIDTSDIVPEEWIRI